MISFVLMHIQTLSKLGNRKCHPVIIDDWLLSLMSNLTLNLWIGADRRVFHWIMNFGLFMTKKI